MIGKLILSTKNIYKKSIDNKSKICKKCIIISENENENEKLIITNKEFNPHDNYIILNNNDTIKQVIGVVGNKVDDLNLYHYLYIKNWISNKDYKKLWDAYIFDDNFDLAVNRIIYDGSIITIDPINSIDLDDGFSFKHDNQYYYLDIHIADPVSYFDFKQESMINIFKELLIRINTCYIPIIDNKNINKNIIETIHLLPNKILNKITLLKENNNINYKRSLCFKFKIDKTNKNVDFEIIPVKIETNNIINSNYDNYDEEINKNIDKKNIMIDFINFLIDIMNLNYLKIHKNEHENISHKMIEIFMIFVNYYTGKFYQKNNKFMIVRNQEDKSQNINLANIPIHVYSFLNYAAVYKLTNNYNDNYHNSLNINNYCHVSSPMRRIVDMINHMLVYNIDIDIIKKYIDIDFINTEIKRYKKISNSYELIKYLEINNTFKACILDFNINSSNITNLLLIVTNNDYTFKKIINVEMPQIMTSKIQLFKYNEINIQIYYNSNNFISSKFPFSIKII